MMIHKKKKIKHEVGFETSFANIVPLFGCAYIKIPDAIITRDSVKKDSNGCFYVNEEKRPYDGVFVTPVYSYSIEFKYNNGRLKDHQTGNGEKINEINGSFFVIRIKDKSLDMIKKGLQPRDAISYSVEKPDKKVITVFNHVEDLIKWFSKERRDARNY